MITVYTTQTCAYCVMAKKYLDMKNVPYETVDLTDEPEKRQELVNKTGYTTVPIITDGEEYIAGWNPAQLAKLISKDK